MPRFFLELSYKGTSFSGFQSQSNAVTVQSAVEKALQVLQREEIQLTGSSRTDAGVHALENYFHLDLLNPVHKSFIYKINAILPPDIVVRRLLPVGPEAHCRFDAVYREYNYFIYSEKNPFLADRAYYFPYRLDWEKMQAAAGILLEYQDFTSFSKRNTQVKTFICQLMESRWEQREGCRVYVVKANRFLRGMVRALTATMLKVGRGKISLDEFRSIIEARDCTRAHFSVPAHGLFLVKVGYPEGFLPTQSI